MNFKSAKKWLCFAMCLCFLCTASCGSLGSAKADNADKAAKTDMQQDDDTLDWQAEDEEVVEITLWTYPVGSWGNASTVSSLISSFHKAYPEIHVSVEHLKYDTGDALVEEAIQSGNLPDLIFEGPERLVANWGDRGYMVNLEELWSADRADEIYERVRAACRHGNGEYYEFPVCMTAHCMAINRDLFAKAGALQYIDEENRTWSTEDFIQAVHALTEYGQKKAGAVYCGGQGGDQGTRALVNNLYGGNFANETHTAYAVNSPENIKALKLLYQLEGISFEPDMEGIDEVESFCKGELAMAFCWNVALEINNTVNSKLDFDALPMTFPCEEGEPRLQGGIWGFGIFDSGDEKRIQAAKTLIQYMTMNDEQYTRAVLASTYWPVREMPDIYINDVLMTEYSIFMQYMGDYYQITPGWSEARKAWWNLLKAVGNGEDIPRATKEFNEIVN